ncbi:MAG: S8 family serine peptidase [Caldilineaceae bacterium]|nr:S8 family serine peptidase [Caldilineaceae bacterium]
MNPLYVSKLWSRHGDHLAAVTVVRLAAILALIGGAFAPGMTEISLAAPAAPLAAYEIMTLPADAQMLNVDPALFLPAAKPAVLDTALSEVAAAAGASPEQALAAAQAQGQAARDGRVQAHIVPQVDQVDAVLQAVPAAGGEITGISGDRAVIQAWLPVQALASLAEHPAIARIRRPAVQSLSQGAVRSEGGEALNVAAWHAAGIRGAGVKVGIIDGGYRGYPSLLGSELPAAVTVRNFVDFETDADVNGTTEHGTACAEIIYDIAPNAQLFFAKISTTIDIEEAVDWLVNTVQVDVISYSGGFPAVAPGDGTGRLADLIAQARSAGVLWVNAAGNESDAHWGGGFADPDGDDIHNFNGSQDVNYFGPGDGNAYNIPAGNLILGFLRWDDWSAVDQDYDLVLLRWNGIGWDIFASGADTQDGGPGQRPVEVVAAISDGGATAYGFAIVRYRATRAVHFEFFAPKVASLDEFVAARSLIHPADVQTVLTVGALAYADPYTLESFSSQGPTNGPGGTESGGIVKPNLGGYDGVSTVSLRPFFGTSAAAPHVAGAAALVATLFPSYGPSQIQSYLEGHAVDLGAAGQDNSYGWGRVTLGALPCYALTLRHTGQGSNPSATPANSPGCASGKFLAGTAINLKATPAAQWYVDSWTGANNDNSTNLTNKLTMPAAAHQVTVAYTDTLQTVELWGRAFVDANSNGKFEQDEDLVEGVKVTLVDTGLSAAGIAPAAVDYRRTGVTDADGIFQWQQVPYNSYYLTIEPPAEYVLRGAEKRVVIVNEMFKPPILIGVVVRVPGMTAYMPILR